MSIIAYLPAHVYGILTYIYHKFKPNVGRYTIDGSYGDVQSFLDFCLFFRGKLAVGFRVPNRCLFSPPSSFNGTNLCI